MRSRLHHADQRLSSWPGNPFQNKKMSATEDILLAIDQGTSSTRAIGFYHVRGCAAVEQQTFEQIYPGPGWVEHDAEVIWATVLSTSRRVLQRSVTPERTAAAVGITNQRETTVLWDRRSGVPIYNAIVWQDRRTAERCRQLARDHGEAERQPQDRPAAGSLFFGHQNRLDPGPRTRCARGRRGRAYRFRHHRQFPHLAADRRRSCI